MPRNTTSKPKRSSDSAQYKRFLETAKEVGASDDPKAFDRAFKKVVASKPERVLPSPGASPRAGRGR